MRLWDYNKNISPNNILRTSTKKFWWKCNVNIDHEWEAPPCNIIRSLKSGTTGCPCCRGFKVVESNCLATTEPEIAKLWHPTKNNITIKNITANSNKKVWWKCPNADDHEWNVSPNQMCRSKVYHTKGCPFCRGLKVSVSNCLLTINPQVAKLWASDNIMRPTEVTSNSAKKVWWICSKINEHKWFSSVDAVVSNYKKSNSACPFCAGKKVGNSNCLAIICPESKNIWHPTKNLNTPWDVTFKSGKKVWGQCLNNINHIWETTPARITRSVLEFGTSGCPFCTHKIQDVTHSCIKNILKDIEIKFQYYIKANDKKFLADFYFEKDNQKYIIEYNGAQHYQPVKLFGGEKSFKKQQLRDQSLRNYCQQNNIILFEIDGRKYYKKEDIKKLLISLL